jgi:endonuclease III
MPNPSIRNPAKSRKRRGLRWGHLLRSLNKFYEVGDWRTPRLRTRGADPFLILISTLLSHRTRDEVTERATLRLLSSIPTPQLMARATPHRIEGIIREVGLSRSKAIGICGASKAIVERFGGRVPILERDLLTLRMVGPKTAHAVRVFGYRRPGIPVDSHILRVTRRLGVVNGSTIAAAQEELAMKVPRRYWCLLNPILVQHGQNICKSRAPRCVECPISLWCPRVGVSASVPGRALIGRAGTPTS